MLTRRGYCNDIYCVLWTDLEITEVIRRRGEMRAKEPAAHDVTFRALHVSFWYTIIAAVAIPVRYLTGYFICLPTIVNAAQKLSKKIT